MLAVVPPRGADLDDSMENFVALGAGGDNFSDAFAGSGDLLHEIDLDDIFIGFDDADGLPDLEVDPNEIFGDISGDGSSSYEQSTTTLSVDLKSGDVEVTPGDMAATAPANPDMEDDGAVTTTETSSAAAVNADVCKGASAPPKSSQSKKKVKVDWTPDLHRRFVQAVEQLGIEKAVPSKILEIMAIEGLTRHNVASHLQKYRSHRKHLLAREAEAATWSQRRRMYGEGVRGRHGGVSAAGAAAGAGAVGNRVAAAPWLAPTMGFPPPPPPATTAAPMHNFRPLHVWGHPTADHAMIHMWPRPLQIPSRPPLPTWVPPADHSAFWQHPHYPRGVPQVSPCLPPPPLPQPTRAAGKPVSGIPPHQPIYKQEVAPALRVKQLQMELLPSDETVDEAIGEILSKPWQPLPLGLKPPSTDGVLSELQRQGISSVPPSSA